MELSYEYRGLGLRVVGAVLTAVAVLGVASSPAGAVTVYQEDFTTDPGFVTSPDFYVNAGNSATWNAALGTYEVHTTEYGPGAPKFAQTPAFSRIAGESFTVQFDVKNVMDSGGMGQAIMFFDGPVLTQAGQQAIGGSNVSVQYYLRDHYSGSDRGSLGVSDGYGSGYDSGLSPSMVFGSWYRVILDYDATAGTADLRMLSGSGFGTTFYESLDFPLTVDPFDRIGFGAQVGNTDGTAAELHVDNVLVTAEMSSPVPEPLTLCGLGMALASLSAYVRRRRKI